MNIKLYKARSLADALQLVRRDLGPQAAVLSTRTVGRMGLLSWIPGLKSVEVAASSDVDLPSRLPPRDDAPPPSPAFQTTPVEATPPPQGPASPPPVHRSKADDKRSPCRSRLSRESASPPQDSAPWDHLVEAGVPPHFARMLYERARTDVEENNLAEGALDSRIVEIVEDGLEVAGPIELSAGQTRVVAFIGPTGVGKTTTIAKIAAQFRLRRRHSVGLVTVDVQRVGAAEQLRAYSELLDLPLEVASSPRQIRDALSRLKDVELILVDTAGRSPRDEIRIRELRAMLQVARTDEVHLVQSASTNPAAFEQGLRAFAPLNPGRLIITKLDETPTAGHLLPILWEGPIPTSYLSHGQEVPNDLEAASQGGLSRLLLGAGLESMESAKWCTT
jgi:flagellar biosynthesis protein FlhF